MKKVYSIALDGPSGSGKTTIAKMLAKKLNIAYLDTGAMYRAVAYFMIKRGINVGDEKSVLKMLDEVDLKIENNGTEQKIILCGEDITDKIRTPEISMGASTVSKIQAVRLKLVELQRAIAHKSSCVLDGRDIGSYVLPDAEYKFFMTADVDIRAKRRYLELKLKNADIVLDDVKADMIARDEQDSSRAFAPLCVPKGAYVVDTTNLTIDEVIDVVLNKVQK